MNLRQKSKLSVIVFVLGLGLAFGSLAQAADSSARDRLEQKTYSATGLLYGQTEMGDLKMFCTITAFERHDKTYRFVTASHCVSEDNAALGKVEVATSNWYITFDEVGKKKFYEAEIIGAGYRHRGDDFAVLEAKIEDIDLAPVDLAKNDPVIGEEVSNIASPLGLGKQLFRGHVSMATLNRPIIEGDINWQGATLLQMSAGPGSSGSAIVSQHQGGICAFLVGVISAGGSPNIVAIPVSKFHKFYKDLQAGKYKWYAPDRKGSSSGDAKSATRIYNRLQKGFVLEEQADGSLKVRDAQ